MVSYRVVVYESSPGGQPYYSWNTYSNFTWTYTKGDWRGTCAGERVTYVDDVEESREPISATFTASDPPHWPPFNTEDPPSVGGDTRAWFLQDCHIMNLQREFAGEDSHQLPGGDRVPTYVATDYDDGSPDDFHTEWLQESGLVTRWSWSQRNTSTSGEITATDATE